VSPSLLESINPFLPGDYKSKEEYKAMLQYKTKKYYYLDCNNSSVDIDLEVDPGRTAWEFKIRVNCVKWVFSNLIIIFMFVLMIKEQLPKINAFNKKCYFVIKDRIKRFIDSPLACFNISLFPFYSKDGFEKKGNINNKARMLVLAKIRQLFNEHAIRVQRLDAVTKDDALLKDIIKNCKCSMSRLSIYRNQRKVISLVPRYTKYISADKIIYYPVA